MWPLGSEPGTDYTTVGRGAVSAIKQGTFHMNILSSYSLDRAPRASLGYVFRRLWLLACIVLSLGMRVPANADLITITESAENGLVNVSANPAPGYDFLSTTVFAETLPHSFHFAQPDQANHWLLLSPTVAVQTGTQLKFNPDPERCPDGSSFADRVEGGNLLEFVCYDASVG